MKNWVWLIGFYINSSLCFTPNSTPIQPWIFALNPTWNGNVNLPHPTTFCNFRNYYGLAEIQDISVTQTIPNKHINKGLFSTIEASGFHSPNFLNTEIYYRSALKIENEHAVLLGFGLQKFTLQNPDFFNSRTSTNQRTNRIQPVFQIGYLSSNLLLNNSSLKSKSKLHHSFWITLGRTNPLENFNLYNGGVFITKLGSQIDSNIQLFPTAKFPFTIDYQLGIATKQLKIPAYFSFHYERNFTYFNSNFLIALRTKKDQFLDLQVAISNTPIGLYFIQNHHNWFLRIGGNWHPQLGISPSLQWYYQWNKPDKKA